MAIDFKKLLKDAKGKYGELVETAKSGFGNEIPDGVYILRWTGLELRESNSGKPQVVFSHTIQEGDQAGQIKRIYRNIDTEDGLGWMLRDMGALGVDLDEFDIENLEDFCEEVNNWDDEEATYFKGRLKTPPKSDFQNLAIVDLLSGYVPDAFEAPDPEPVKEDPKPKTSAKSKETAAAEPAPKAAAKGKGKAAPAPEPEPEPEPEDNEAEAEPEAEGSGETELQKGMKVKFTTGENKGKVGILHDFDEEEGTAVVKLGLKKIDASFDDLELV